jgi:hypothetical protein
MSSRIALTAAVIAGPPCLLVLLQLALGAGLSPAGARSLLLPITAWVWVALFIAPAAILFPRQPPPHDGDRDDDGGGGGGHRPDPRPAPPGGGIPLPDATQASARRRDHVGPLHRRAARREHPPAPRRVRTGPGRRRTHARA